MYFLNVLNAGYGLLSAGILTFLFHFLGALTAWASPERLSRVLILIGLGWCVFLSYAIYVCFQLWPDSKIVDFDFMKMAVIERLLVGFEVLLAYVSNGTKISPFPLESR